MTSAEPLAPLLQPGQIGNLRLKNRLVQAPMHTRFASHFGEVTDRLIDYHQERARGGVGLIILENTAVDWEVGRAAGNPVRIDDDVFVSGLSDLTSAVHAEGVGIAAQLHHAGRQNSSSNTIGGAPPVAPSPIMSHAIGEVPRELDISELPAIVQSFADGARRAVAAGFDLVEIHGSHGYLLTQFLSPESNQRTDEYGGSFENRARFPLEVVRAVREAVGPDFPISYRISIEERTPGGMEADEGIEFCKLIEEYVDVFNVTVATYDSMNWIFTMQGVQPGALLPVAARVRAAVERPVMGISRLGWALEEASTAVEAGELDFVAMARTQLADPRLVEKTLKGHPEQVRRCIACNECVGGFLFQGWRVHCVINPELGMEHKLSTLLAPAADPHDVLVVGGGPAGCEAARVAAMRGHRVRLIDREDGLGGQLRASSAPGFKRREMEAYIRYFEVELERLGVEIVLGEEFKQDMVDEIDARTLVLATGSAPATEVDAAADAVAVLASRALPDGDVLVRGCNEIGLNAAAYAAEQGRRTVLATGGKEPGYDMNPLLAAHTTELLTTLGVDVVEDIGSWDGAVLEAADRVKEENVWYAPSSLRVVDARTGAGRLFEATQKGFYLGTRI